MNGIRRVAHRAAGAIALTLGACASAPSPATEAETGSALHTYRQCLQRNAAGLDDGLTDAATVGRAIAFACQDARETALATLTRGHEPDKQAAIRQQFAREDDTLLPLIVLQRRAGIAR